MCICAWNVAFRRNNVFKGSLLTMQIIKLNEYAIDVNGKLMVKSIDREIWLCDNYITQDEHEAFQKFIEKQKQKLTNKIKLK